MLQDAADNLALAASAACVGADCLCCPITEVPVHTREARFENATTTSTVVASARLAPCDVASGSRELLLQFDNSILHWRHNFSVRQVELRDPRRPE